MKHIRGVGEIFVAFFSTRLEVTALPAALACRGSKKGRNFKEACYINAYVDSRTIHWNGFVAIAR